jgi:hypothetical protein
MSGLARLEPFQLVVIWGQMMPNGLDFSGFATESNNNHQHTSVFFGDSTNDCHLVQFKAPYPNLWGL